MLHFCRLRNLCQNNRHKLEFVSCCKRLFHPDFEKPEIKNDAKAQSEAPKPLKEERREMPPSLRFKYRPFTDANRPPILDVEEEKLRFQVQDEPEEPEDLYMGLNVKRGLHGVFDIEDLVDVLRKENAEDIFVCSVPKELNYVDYMVVCSGRSYRHMLAMAEFIRRMYKIKRHSHDIVPKIEGEKSREWMAMDLGNIALHIFTPKVREQYDLESLWAIGAEYDKACNKPTETFADFYDREFLSNIQPKG